MGRAEDDTGTPVYHFIAVVSLRQPCCQTKTPFEVDSTNSETTRWNTGIKKGLSLPSDNDERNTYWDKVNNPGKGTETPSGVCQQNAPPGGRVPPRAAPLHTTCRLQI